MINVTVSQDILTIEQNILTINDGEHGIITIVNQDTLIPQPSVDILEVGAQGPAGVSGIISEFVAGETPSGAVNGINATFQTAFDFIPESVSVMVNGLVQRLILDFNTSGVNTLIFSESPGSGDSVRVSYLKG